jgi:murein DD-endopeptidase MepM/ murein hydrolase activator NlpD
MKIHRFVHIFSAFALASVIASAGFAYSDKPAEPVVAASVEIPTSTPAVVEPVEEVVPPVEIVEPTTTKLGSPISNALNRVTKKHFGLEIHPETSPVKNDRFNGFHVGTDFETTPAEQDIDIEIFAMCDGPLIAKNFAKGYGGFALQACKLDGEDIQVIYGHMDLASITIENGARIMRGETIGVLGQGYSPETDGVRKHLHLGIHHGTSTDIRGYVQKPEEIGDWLDPVDYIK